MSDGGFRGRGFGPRGHYRQGPNGPVCANPRGRGARSDGANLRPNVPVGPRPVGPNSHLSDGPNSRGSNFRGGTGGPHGIRSNFNSPRRPPRHPSRPSDNWSPRGGGPHFAPWRGGRPPRFNGPPRPPFFRGRGQPNNFGGCRYPFMAGNMQPMLPDVPPPPEPKPATPHLGSEEERVQKITEAADELKRKLSAVPNEPDVWCNEAEDDAALDFSSEADYPSSISSRGIPELKHDPPELNLTLNDLRDIGRVDHDHSSKHSRDAPDNASNSSFEDSEVTILDYNPVQTMIEIDLWSDDNYMEFEDGVGDGRTIERSATATATIGTPSDSFQDSSQDRAENCDTPVPSEDSRDFGKNDAVENESMLVGENKRGTDCENRTLEEKPETSGVQTEKRFCALDEKIRDTIINDDPISSSNRREEDSDTSPEENVNCTESDKLEAPSESKKSPRNTLRIAENSDEASQFDDNSEPSRNENLEASRTGVNGSSENKRITDSGVESAVVEKIVTQADGTSEVREGSVNAIGGDNTMEINESMLNGNERSGESSVNDATLTNDRRADSEVREISEPAIVKETKASVKQMRIEIGGGSTGDVKSPEARREATGESRFENRSSLAGDNEKSKAQEQQRTSAITKKAHSASISEDRQERKENNITHEARKEERKREEPLWEGRENDTRKQCGQPAESFGRPVSESNSNARTEARDKTEQPTRIEPAKDTERIEDSNKKIVDKPSPDGASSSSEKKIDEEKLPIIDSKKICERRKLVRRMPDVKALPRNRKSMVGDCTLESSQRVLAAVNFDKGERPVVFDPREPPPAIIPYTKSIRTPDTTGQETGINSQIPPAFDPRLTSRERSALLTAAPLAPSSIPVAQDPFGMTQAYPPCQITSFVPSVASINYGAPPPTIIGAPMEPPICLADPYAPLLPLATMSATIPLPAKAPIMLQPPLPVAPPPPPSPLAKSGLDMVDELEDMHEAMEFAKTFMNMNEPDDVGDADDSADSDFFHMPTFPDLPPIELPPLPPPDPPPASAIPPPVELPPRPSNGLEAAASPVRRPVSNNSKQDRKPAKDEPTTKKEPIAARGAIGEGVDAVEEEPSLLSDDCIRPKVIFNVTPKTTKLTKPDAWLHQDHTRNAVDAAGQAKTKLTAQPASSPIGSTTKERTRPVNGHEDRDKSRADRRTARPNGAVGSGNKPEESTKVRSRSPSPPRKSSKDDNSRSTPTDHERNGPSTRRKDAQDANSRKSTDPATPESTWKSRVIGRFLKMSKNDIRNMLNNTSLRKFDIAMKHLVKERRSSLSLGVRNTDDEKTKTTGASYNREEFMDQLSAMLDPSATVDFCNLPTQFIHHLSEVLQLDSMAEFESTPKTSEPTESKSSPCAGRRTAPSSVRRVPRATPPSANVKEIDDRRPTGRGRENKSMSTATTPVAGAEAAPSSAVTRILSSRTHDDSVDSRCPNAPDTIAESTNANRGTAPRPAARARRGRSSLVRSRSPINGMSARNPDRDTVNMADLDEIFSAGLAREKKKLSSLAAPTTRCEKRSIDSGDSPFAGHNEVARDPSVDRVERAAVELDKIFTAGIARFKLPSIKAAMARPAEANDDDDDDDDEDGNWHRDERKSCDDGAARSHQRSVSRLGSRSVKWTRTKAYEDRDSFRNLTKEEWEARYGGESSYVSYEQEYRAIAAMRARRSEYEAVQEPETGVRSRLGNEVHPEGGVHEAWSDSDEAARYRNADEPVSYEVTRGRVSGDSSSSSSVSTSSSSSDDEHEAAPSVTQLLKVIKAKEKIAKKRSINEEIRDEVTAEIERKRRERGKVHKSRHKSRLKKSSHRRRKDRKDKVKERKKRGRKRRRKRSRRSGSGSRESSEEEEDEDDEESEEEGASSSSRGRRTARLLTENEIKKEIVIKDEPDTESIPPAHVQVRSRSSLAIRLNDESRPPSTSSASSLPAMPISTSQPKTKAQLKQMPTAVKKIPSATVVSNQTAKIEELPPSEAKEVTGKVLVSTSATVEASPAVAEPVKSSTASSSTPAGAAGQIQPAASPSDEVHSSLKTNSKKLDIKAYKERARQRQIRETEKLRDINENPSVLTQDLLNISINRKNPVEPSEDAAVPRVAATISNSAVVSTTPSPRTVVSRKTSPLAVVPASSARKTIATAASPRKPISTAPVKSISTPLISGKSISTSPTPGKSIPTSPTPGKSVSTSLTRGKSISTSPTPGKSIPTSSTPGKSISTSATPGKLTSTSVTPGKSISTSATPGKSISTLLTPGKSMPTSPTPGKSISNSTSPGKPASTSAISVTTSSTVETTKAATPDGNGSQSLPAKSTPPKKLIRRRSVTTAPKVDAGSTTVEARAEAGKFAHIKSEGSKEMKLREKLKKPRPRASLDALESTIPTGKPARVRKRGSTSSGTNADDGATVSLEKEKVEEQSKEVDKHEEEQTTLAAEKNKEDVTIPSDGDKEEQPGVASGNLAEERSAVSPEKRTEEQATAPSEKLEIQEAAVTTENRTEDQDTVSSMNVPEERSTAPSESLAIEQSTVASEDRSEKQSTVSSAERSEDQSTVSPKEDTKEQTIDSENILAEQSTSPSVDQPEINAASASGQPVEEPEPPSKAVTENNFTTNQSESEKSEVLKFDNPVDETTGVSSKEHTKDLAVFAAEDKSEALEASRSKPSYLDLFKKAPKSASLPDTAPLEPIQGVQIAEKLDDILVQQEDLHSPPMPITDLPGWSITPNIGNELNDSSEDPPFRGFTKDPIIRRDRVLTDTEGNISEIDDLGRVPLEFEDGTSERAVGVLDLDDVTSTGVSLEAPLSYGDDEFVEGGVAIETSLLGFPAENEMSDEPEAIAVGAEKHLVTDEFEKSAVKSFNEESSHESAETISRVTPSLNDSPAPDDFLIGEVERQESIPSPLLVSEHAGDEQAKESTGSSSKDNVEESATENTLESKINAAEPGVSDEPETPVEFRTDAAEVENKETTVTDSPGGTQHCESTETSNTGALTCDNEILSRMECKVETETFLYREKSSGPPESQESLAKPVPEEAGEEPIVESRDSAVGEGAQIDPATEPVSRQTPPSGDMKEEIKEAPAEKPRTVGENRQVAANKRAESHRGGAKFKDHGRVKGKSSRHRNHASKVDKKGALTEKLVEEAVAANIVKVVPKPSSKESVLARMIEIDVEIHKLMNEKMTLYTMLQSGEFPAKESLEEATSDRNNDDTPLVADREETITDIAPPTVLASHLVRNFDKTVLMTPSIVQEPRKISSDTNGKTKKRKKSPQREPKNPEKEVEVAETRRERKNSESKSHSRRTTSEESSRQESASTHSREKSTSSTEPEDPSENRRKRRTKLKDSSNRQAARRAREDSSKDDPGEVSLGNADRSAKSTTREVSPKTDKAKRKTKSSADASKIDESSRASKSIEEKSSSIVPRPSEKIGSVIYSDESTWDSLEPETVQSDEQRSKGTAGGCTGLALLEESFKREMAQTRKLKAVERRKNKKLELRRVILDPPALTADEEETPLSDLYERKNSQNKENRSAKSSRGKSVGSSNEDPVRVWKHITSVIDAVASDRVDQLYARERSPNSRGSTPPSFHSGDNDLERERSPSISPPESIGSNTAEQLKTSRTDDSETVQRGETDSMDSDHAEPEETSGSRVSKKSKEVDENHPSESRESETGDTTSTSERSSSAEDNNKRSREAGTPSGESTPGLSDHDVVVDRNTTSRSAVDTPVGKEENDKEELSASVAETSKKSASASPQDRANDAKAAEVSLSAEPSSTGSSAIKSFEIKESKLESREKLKDESREKLKEEPKEKLKEESKDKFKVESKEKFKDETKEKPKDDEPRVKLESRNPEGALDKTTKEKTPVRRSSKDRERERSRSHSRSDRPSKGRSVTPRELKRERERKSSSRADDGRDREDKRSGRPKSATKRKQREKSNPPNRRNSRYSEDRSKRSRSKKRDRERSGSRGGSPHGSEPSRKRAHRPHRSASPKSHSTSADDQARRRGRKRKRRAEMTREQMMNCKVQLIDCKYTYLSPDMHPRVLKKFGISRINPYVAPRLVAESSSPPDVARAESSSPQDVARAETPSPPTLTRVETPAEDPLEDPIEESSKDVDGLRKPEDPREAGDKVVIYEAEDEDGVDETIQIVKVVEDTQNPTMSDQDEEGEASAPEIIDDTSCPGDPAPQDVIAIEDETTGELELKNTTNDDEVEVLEDKRTSAKGADKPNDKSQRSPDSELEDDIDYETRTRYTVHKGPILDIKVLDDSFLAASEDGAIYRYSQTSNGILNIYKGHEAAVTCIYVLEMPDKRWSLYSGSLDGTFRCYDITTGVQERPPADVGSPVQCMDQAWGVIFVGTKSGHISRYNIKSGSIKGDRLEFSDKSVLALKASSEGPRRVLIVASRNQPITIRDALTGLFLRTICGYKSHTVYSLMRERNLVYCGTSSTSIPVFDFTNGDQVTQYNAGVGIVCMRLYRQILFAGCYDGNIYVFDTKEPKLIVSIPGPGNMLLSMEVIGDEIIAGSKNRQLHSWRMPKQVRALLSERT